MILRRDLLSGLGVEEVQIRLGNLSRAAIIDDFVHDRNRRLRQDTCRGVDHFILIAAEFLEPQLTLIFPRYQHITQSTFGERDSGVANIGVQHGDVLVETGDELTGLGVVVVVFLQGCPVRRKICPSRPAGGLWIRDDDLHAVFHQVVPCLEALGISLAHQPDNCRGKRRAVVGESLLPVCGNEIAMFVQRVDVIRQAERDHVCLESVDDGAGLLTGTAMRLLHGNVLSRL